jgi:ABC-type antimicrobial peptide transport system permease subunit
VLALLVAAIGLYGVIAYGVRRRTHELGIRIALGAQRDRISRLVVGEGVRMVAGGVLAGVALALVSVRFVGSLLYDTSLRDPLVLLGVVIVMLATAFAASWIPAWRAGRVDPMVALRGD